MAAAYRETSAQASNDELHSRRLAHSALDSGGSYAYTLDASYRVRSTEPDGKLVRSLYSQAGVLL